MQAKQVLPTVITILNMRTHFPFLILLIFCFFIILTSGQRNISIDDWDAAIYYRPPGAWYMSTNTSLNFGGAHMLTQNPNATALFNFTGVAIYFLSPRWPYQVTTALSLDGGPVTVVDLVDHSRPDTGGFGAETVPYDVVWSAEGLPNVSHSLLISVGAGQSFAIVDGLIYTIVDNGVDSSASPTPTPTVPPTPSTLPTGSVGPSTSPIPSSTPSHAPAAGSGLRSFIAVGTVLGVLGLLIVALLIWCCFRKKRARRPKSEGWTFARSPSKGTPSPTTMSAPSSISLGPPATYPMPPISGFQHPYHSMYVPPLSEEEAWQSPRYGYVGMPAPITSPTPSVHSAEPYARTYDLNYLTSGSADGGPMMAPTSAHSLWRYTPGVPLSPITENSPSTTEKSLSLRGSPSALSEKATSTRSDISGARTPTGFRGGSQLAQPAFTASPF